MRPNPKYSLIWAVVKKIPKGKVSTYGDIANLAGFPRCARMVGTALRAAPVDVNIPWYRVVNSQGKISFLPGSEKFQLQKQHLEEEGIRLMPGIVNFSHYRWGSSLDKDLWGM